jgi:hypothetical protein
LHLHGALDSDRACVRYAVHKGTVVSSTGNKITVTVVNDKTKKPQRVRGDRPRAGPAPFAYLGAKHVVTGYDHLLFLVGVIFFLFRLSDVVKYVSLFTLGHSLRSCEAS